MSNMIFLVGNKFHEYCRYGEVYGGSVNFNR